MSSILVSNHFKKCKKLLQGQTQHDSPEMIRPPAGVGGGAAELVGGDGGGAGDDAEIGAPPGTAEGREALPRRRARHCHLGSSLRCGSTNQTHPHRRKEMQAGDAEPTERVDIDLRS